MYESCPNEKRRAAFYLRTKRITLQPHYHACYTDNFIFPVGSMVQRTSTACNALFMPFATIPVFLLYSILHKEIKPFGMRHRAFQFFGWTDFYIPVLFEVPSRSFLCYSFHFVSSLYVMRCLELQSKQLNLSLPSNSL